MGTAVARRSAWLPRDRGSRSSFEHSGPRLEIHRVLLYSPPVGEQKDAEHPLRITSRPAFEAGNKPYRVVDLFCGCGGITLGVAQAARETGLALEVRLAVDFEADAAETYATNFPKAVTRVAPVEEMFDGELGATLTRRERRVADEVGEVAALGGGPPCQGHSDLNNHTRRDDPKNVLYIRMARAAEVLRPDVVFIENVPTVRHAKGNVVGAVTGHLRALGYSVADGVVRLEALGVAQRRRRHVLLAIKTGAAVSPQSVLDGLVPGAASMRDLRWAIGDLADIKNGRGIDKEPRASATNRERMAWLLENDQYDLPNVLRPTCHRNNHSYKSMYGRLRWNEPAQTVTSGFGSIGQGRYMHPELTRALTAHEAARLQGFPDYFQFSTLLRRDSLATMIGNAVPPQLAYAVFSRVIA